MPFPRPTGNAPLVARPGASSEDPTPDLAGQITVALGRAQVLG